MEDYLGLIFFCIASTFLVAGFILGYCYRNSYYRFYDNHKNELKKFKDDALVFGLGYLQMRRSKDGELSLKHISALRVHIIAKKNKPERKEIDAKTEN